jgi:hypothetical protein
VVSAGVRVAARFVATTAVATPARINELFVRLNRNKTLTGPEIRNAMEGIVPESARKLARHPFFTSRVRFSTNRGQDLDTAAKFLLVEFLGTLAETKRGSLDRLVEDALAGDADVDDIERAAGRVERNLDRMMSVFQSNDSLLASQGAMVPYYWLVRALDDRDLSEVRPFLVHFEKDRAANRKLANSLKL